VPYLRTEYDGLIQHFAGFFDDIRCPVRAFFHGRYGIIPGMKADTSMQADERFVSAAHYQEVGELEVAVGLYVELIEDYPDNLELLLRAGYTLAQSGRLPEALMYLQRAVDSNPDAASAWYNLGMAQECSGDSDAAIDSLRHALVCDSNHHAARIALSELFLPYEHYMEILKRVHRWLRPANYLEIGVESGASMVLAEPPTLCLGVDPEPQIQFEFSAPTQIFEKTSDDFFAEHDLGEELGGKALDLAFVDGLHHFDAALRDFINIERHSTPATVVLFHDGIPLDEETAARERKTMFWSGDTWKIIPLLKKYRPDLKIFTIPAPPTGLTVVMGLDSESKVLAEKLDAIVDEYMTLDYSYLGDKKDEVLSVVYDDWASIQEQISTYRPAPE